MLFSGYDTELETNRTTNADPASESEYESEPSEESESSEEESVTDTEETETIDTGRGLLCTKLCFCQRIFSSIKNIELDKKIFSFINVIFPF